MSSPATAAPRAARPLAQRWASYRPEEHRVWETLYRRRIEELRTQASAVFLDGISAVGLEAHRIPDLREVNRRLAPLTGWRAVPVGGFLEASRFFASLGRRRFPTTITIRSPDSLEYTPEPDIFHDVFGHVPLHADPRFAEFLRAFGAVAARCRDGEAITRMARLFWFTVEFGLIREQGRVRVYGSGLISSSAEAAHALGGRCVRRPFRIEEVLETPFAIDRIQEILFVIDDFETLFASLGGLRRGGRI